MQIIKENKPTSINDLDLDFSFLDDIDFNLDDDILNLDDMQEELIETLKDIYGYTN